MSGLLTATHMGSVKGGSRLARFPLGGLTIMPYMSHSVSRGQPIAVPNVSLGYTDQDCGDHRFAAAAPSPLRFDTHDFAPEDQATQRTGNHMWFSRYAGVFPEGQCPDSTSWFNAF